METIISTNEFQTAITKELLESYPAEVSEQFMDYMDTVPLLKWMVGERPRAKDLPRDEFGRIIVDITHPHILEDMDYFRPAIRFYQENGAYSLLRPNNNPNSEYGKWFYEEVRRCREGYVRESDGEWVTGMMYWFLNYCPIMISVKSKKTGIVHRVEGFPAMWEGIYYRFHYIEQARRQGKHCVELARRGAHPYYQKVYTPDGIKAWGEINVGDKLFGTYGNITTVTSIPFDDEADVYKLTLRDGRTVYASDDHIWNVVRKNGKVSQRNTKYLSEHYKLLREPGYRIPSGEEHQYFIPKNDGVEFTSTSTPIDSYTLGMVLGDGCFRVPNYRNQVTFTSSPEDIDNYISECPYPIVKYGSDSFTYSVKVSTSYLYDCGLWMKKSEEKFVPDLYKYNDKEVRLRLLQGLFDTDGWVHGNVPVLDTTSERLRDDVMEIARSLGYESYWTKKKAGYKKDGVYKQCLDVYEVSVYAGSEIFTLSRKKEKVDNSKIESRGKKCCIVNIEYIGRQKCKCVTVDAKDSSYLIGDFIQTHNCGKSFGLAAIMAHNLILGEDSEATKRVTTVLTAYTKEYLAQKDGTFSKFTPMIDFTAQHTEFPRLMLTRRSSDMLWVMGYKDYNKNEKGSLNSVMGLSVKDDEGKIRGKRGFILFEEMGNYPNFKDVWDNVRDSVKNGDDVFSLMYAVGTAGDEASDFSSIRTILYKPNAYEVLALDNVYDKKGKGVSKFAYFFPSYISREGCMDKDGNSDVVKALFQILMERYMVKQGGDAASLLKRIAQMPVTPEEAILRVQSTYFPTVQLNERLRQLDSLPHIFDDIYIGELIEINGKVSFRSTHDVPIREYPVDNTTKGALEIYTMPPDTIPYNRYCIGVDPVDNDKAESQSLMSIIVFDLFNDEIAAEYTGRQEFAESGYEIVRLLSKFYNAPVLYEAHPYEQIVRLPDGSTRQWGDIKIGDTLFAPKGKTVKVVDIPMDGEDDIYKVTFADGRTVEASAGHIWSVYKNGGNNDRYKLHNIKTAQMATDKLISRFGRKKYFVPESGAVDYQKQDVPIDAYTLGLLIAKGTLGLLRTNKIRAERNREGVPFAACGEDLEFYKSVIPYPIQTIGGYTNHIVYIDYAYRKLEELRFAGTNSHTKFIPEQYLYNDYNTRLELLKGLMDGDGCAAKNGASVFVTTSRRLADDVMLLCRSLGIKATENAGRKDRYESFKPSEKVNLSKKSYRIAIATTIPIFKLPRKAEKQHIYNPKAKGSKAQGLIERNGIVSVEYVGRKRCKCVTVDSPDGLYLIGDYVVTHNCNRKMMYAYFSKKHCLNMLAECPEWIKQKGLVKYSMFGSSAKGVSVNGVLISTGIELINDWLKKPVPVEVKDENGESIIETNMLLYTIRNRALLQEMVAYAPEKNTDRVSALFQVMYYREQYNILYGDAGTAYANETDASDDPFFNDAWKQYTSKFGDDYHSALDL